MTSGGPRGGADGELDQALDAYAGFLAHQLAEVVVLLSGLASEAPVVAARSRLERMLTDLRDLRPAPREHVPVQLAMLAGQVAKTVGAPGRPVRVRAANDLPVVAGDPELLRTLVGHLMRAALARNPNGVTVSLRAAIREDGRVEVELEQPCGPGDATAVQRALKPFERPAGTGALVGAGVSGPVSVRIVLAHGGSLRVRHAGDTTVTAFDLAAVES